MANCTAWKTGLHPTVRGRERCLVHRLGHNLPINGGSTGGGAVAPTLGVPAAPPSAILTVGSVAPQQPATPIPSAPVSAITTHPPRRKLTPKQVKAHDEVVETVFDLAGSDQYERARLAAFKALEIAAREGTKPNRQKYCSLVLTHALCCLFEELAVALHDVSDAPKQIVNALVDKSNLPTAFLKSVVKYILGKMIDVARSTSADPVQAVYMQVCLLALVFCPDPDKHPGNLNENCALPIGKKLTEPESA